MARDNQLYSLPLGAIAGTEYVVRGKIDRIIVEDGEIVLVEVKSRMNKLFREVREYEYIQVRLSLPPSLSLSLSACVCVCLFLCG